MAIRISPRAEFDFIDIDETISRDDPAAADKLVGDIMARFPVLESMPRMGVRRYDIRTGLRMFAVRGYLIFYLATSDGIEIVCVVNGVTDHRSTLLT